MEELFDFNNWNLNLDGDILIGNEECFCTLEPAFIFNGTIMTKNSSWI
jgi:hypothetical protein